MVLHAYMKKQVTIRTFVLYATFIMLAGVILPSVHSDPGDPWWNTNWTYRKEITIDHTKVTSSLNHFPFLIRLTDTDLKSKAQTDGDDIVFTDSLGSQLHHEIETYSPSTGALVAWIDVPNLSATQDTTLYLYYGNPSASNQQNIEATWDVNFLAVHHLDETSGTIIDSTSHNNDGIPTGSPNQNTQGKIDGADGFDGIDDHFTLPRVYTSETQFTMECWIYAQSGARYILSQRSSTGVFIQLTSNYLQYYINGISDGRSISFNTWYHVVLTYDGSTANLYLNGVGRLKTSTAPTWPAEGLYIGDRSAGSRPFYGTIDEVRFSNIARSNGWVTTCYSNQNNPTGFITVGLEETNQTGHSPVISNEYPLNGAVNVSLTLSQLRFTLTDADNDLLDCSVITTPDIIGGIVYNNDVLNGTTLTIPITTTPLNPSTSYTWRVRVTDGMHWSNVTYQFMTQASSSNTWLYRKQITINHTQVNTPLTNYPLLLKLTDPDLAIKAQEDGDDIYFTDGSNTQLNHELEQFNGTTGELLAWIKIPSLSPITDTIIYMYYGNTEASNQEHIEATWDNSYLAVHHLSETTGAIIDSTSHSNDGIPAGSPDRNVLGKIDGADGFNSIGDHFTLPQMFTNENQFTIECWISAQTGARYFISQRSSSSQGIFLQITGTYLQYYINGISDGKTISLNTWYHVVLTYSSLQATLYINGVARTKVCTPPTWPSQGLYIGDSSSGTRQFYGIIDEVRFSNVARTNGWILTCYNNQNNPGSFYSLGPEENTQQNNAPIISNEQPTNGATNVPITLSNLSFLITNLQDIPLSCTITTTPDIIGGVYQQNDINSGTTVTIPIVTTLTQGTIYTWHISATNEIYWTNRTFSFTTFINTKPILSNPYPSDNAYGIGINPVLAITINDNENDNVNVIFMTNASTGVWHQLGTTQNGIPGRYSQLSSGMNQNNKKYWWPSMELIRS